MKVLYAPLSLVAGLLGHRAGKKAFTAAWGKVSDSPKPTPTQPGVSIAQVTVVAALEAATVAAAAAAAHTLAARGFHRVTGAWPGARRADKSADAPAEAAV